MIISRERNLKKEFLKVRDKIASECSLDLESELELHKELLNACLGELESGNNAAILEFSHRKGTSLVPLKMRERIESLLEMASGFSENPSVVASMFEMKPEAKTKKEKRGKYGEKHGERRKSGRFYTPLAMARIMVEILIGEYLEDGDIKEDLKILDPSVGCGIFPDVVYSELEKRGFEFEKILNSLYGVDQDETALELTSSSIRIKSGGHRIPPKQLIKGDFLLDELNHPGGGYDLIIGNPPYISYYSRESQANSDRVKSELVTRYGNFGGGSANTFLYFIVRGIELLKDKGMLCFIVPDKLLWNRRYGRIRKYILETASPRFLYTAGENVFEGATVGNVIVILQKGVANKKCSVGVLKEVDKRNSFIVTKRKKVNIKEFLNQRDYRFVASDPLIKKIAQATIPLSRIAYVRDGINPAFKEFRERVLSNEKKGEKYRGLIEGGDIEPFRITPRSLYINYDKSIVTPELRNRGVSFRQEWIFDATMKLVNRQTADRLIFAFDENKLCSLNSVHNTILKENYAEVFLPEVDNTPERDRKDVLFFLLGVLNSRLMNYYYRSVSQEVAKNFPQVHIADLNELPIKIPELSMIRKIAGIVEQITGEKKNVVRYLDEMDACVYDLYGVSHKERKKILKKMGDEWRV